MHQLEKTVITLLVAPFLITLMLCAIIIGSVYHEHVNEQLLLTNDALIDLQKIVCDMDDAETGERGFLLTNDSNYLAPYNKAKVSVVTDLNQLENLPVVASSVSIKLLDTEVHDKLVELATTLKLSETDMTEAVVEVKSNKGKVLMDQIRTTIDNLRVEILTDYGNTRHAPQGGS